MSLEKKARRPAKMKAPITMIPINDRAGAQAPQELPPAAPCCKVVFNATLETHARKLCERQDTFELFHVLHALRTILESKKTES